VEPRGRSDTSPPAAHRAARERLPGVDGLRGLAAGSVLLYHCWLHGLGAGGVGIPGIDAAARHLSAGVLLFFTLSGLLLYRPFAAAILSADGPPSLRRYAQNRVLRIFPAYLVVLGVVGVVASTALVPGRDDVLVTGSLLDHPRTLLADVLLVQTYAPSTFLTGIGPAWTLTIEVAFYATLPLFAAAALLVAPRTPQHLRPAVALAPAAVLLVIGLAGKGLVAATGEGSGFDRSWHSVAARSFLANADLFAFGMAVAVVLTAVAGGWLTLPVRWRSSACGIAAVCLVVALRLPGGGLGEPRYDLLVALASGLLVSVLVVEPRSGAATVLRPLEHRSAVAIGLASYSLYLWHEPVILWAAERGWPPRSGLLGLALVVALVVAAAGSLSWLTYRLVERPLLVRRRPAPSGHPEGSTMMPSSASSTTTVDPSATRPSSSADASRSATSRWITRFSGRAPKAGS
jgi:peptidoglycan/LPS O-acetylase OafA/YrhL